MTITAGALSQVSVGSNSASLSATAAFGGSGPYTQQWYYTTSGAGFSPGGGNIITGATALTLDISGLNPNTTYYFKVVYTDTGHSNDTATSTALTVITAAVSLSQNQFRQEAILGMPDMPYNYNTKAMQIDGSQSGNVYPGSPVKVVDSAGGVPKVVLCTASNDVCFGFVNYNIKNAFFTANKPVEVSQTGNVMYLYSTGAVARGTQVVLDIANNGVAQATGSTTSTIVGYSLDKATAQGQLIRVELAAPSFLLDS